MGAAVLAGQIAGLCAAAVLMVVYGSLLEEGPLHPLRVLAAFLLGDAALDTRNLFAPVLGLAFLQGVPVLAWSLVFGLWVNLFEARRGWSLLFLCFTLAILAQLVNVDLFAPLWLEGLWGHDLWAEEIPMRWSWLANLAFGMGLMAFPWAYEVLWGVRPQNWFGRRRTDPVDPLGA
ncbi:MAG: hypothetical protein ACOZNI_12015 [Myxococcota bacterium]